MYTPAGKAEPIPGTSFAVLPVVLYPRSGIPAKKPTGYVLIEYVTDDGKYITHTGLFLSPFGAVRECVLLVDPNVVFKYSRV